MGAVSRDGGEIAREDQRNAGRQHRRPLEASRRSVALSVTSRAGYRQSDGRCQRKDEKNAHRDGEAALFEETGDPDELVERGEAERQPRQHGPDLPIRHPRETHIEEQQVREERDGTILPGGHQRRRREAAQQPEHRDEERLAPDGEQHRERCHNREKDERRGRGDEIPQRVRGEERGEQNRDRRAVQGVGSRGVLARGLQLTEHEEHDGHENTDSDADGRLEPSLIDGVAQEKDCREHERDAGNPGKQLDADQALPVEGWRGRRGGKRWLRGRNGSGSRDVVQRRNWFRFGLGGLFHRRGFFGERFGGRRRKRRRSNRRNGFDDGRWGRQRLRSWQLTE